MVCKFELGVIPPELRGQPRSEVTFENDSSVILNVGAKDEAIRKGEPITDSECNVRKSIPMRCFPILWKKNKFARAMISRAEWLRSTSEQ